MPAAFPLGFDPHHIAAKGRKPLALLTVTSHINVPFQVGDTFLQGDKVFLVQLLEFDAAVELEGAEGSDDHDGVRTQARFAALDVDEFFSPRSAPKPASVTT